MKKFLLSIAWLLCLQGYVMAQSEKESETAIMMKMLGLKNALINEDSSSLAHLLADEVTYGHSNGLIQSKAELIRSIMSREQDYKTIEPSDMKIRIYDKAGLVTMKGKVNMLFNGQPLDINLYIMLTWIYKKNDWILVARQAVKL